MNQELDILINESRSRIASLIGRAEELKSLAQHEQRMLEALCKAQEQLQAADSKKEQATYTPPIPRENKYNEVREYIEERRKYDADFKYFCDTHNRKELSDYLSKEFGWIVDDNSLGKSINRHL